MAVIPQGGDGGGAGAGGSGWVKIVDIATQDVSGTVTNKVFQDPPNNTVLNSCTVSDLDLTISIKASYPIVDIGGSLFTMPEATDGGHYEDDIDVTVSAGQITVQVQTPDGTAGAEDNVDVTLDAPPELLTFSFTGGYPGSQTELKAGDTFQLTGTTDKDADAIEIQEFGAMVTSLETFAQGTSFTVTGTIKNQGTTLQALSARARARAPTGALGGIRDTNVGGGGVDGVDLVNLNNTFPTALFGAVTYPPTQGALKASEQATVAVSLANLDTVLFDSPVSELSITNPALIEPTKTVTRIAGGYNVSTDNLRVTANRAANDATTINAIVVKIANTAATIDVALAAARLRSGGNDGTTIQNHTITIQSDQDLLNAPSMDEDTGGGTFTGSWTGGPQDWTRTLQVHDDDTKGVYSWQNLVATNLAGVVTNTVTTGGNYTLGGFVQRDLTFAAFATTTSMNVEAVDFSKIQAGIFTATNQPALKQAIGTPPPVTNGYTLNSLAVKPTTVIWLDTAAASTNSTGTAQITDVEELA